MAPPDTQTMWVPYENIKDCSQGFCSIYCPQWCYIIFPPPPPVDVADDSSGPNLSPLVIAVIGILASAFLLVGYYTIISKYCGRLDSLRRQLGRDTAIGGGADEGLPRHDGWYAPAGGGLEETVIKSIAVFRYQRGDGLVEGTDCAVCLGEFGDGDSLRLLPKCSHAFHVACIDTWLKSHASCPLCRAGIVPPTPGQPPARPTAPLEPPNSPPLPEIRQDTIIVAEDVEMGRDGEEEQVGMECGQASPIRKSPASVHSELGGPHGTDGILVELGDGGAQPIRRSVSMDAFPLGRFSVADVLGMDMEAAFPEGTMPKDHHAIADEDAGSSTGHRVEHRACKASSRTARALHCVACSPAPMKRSFSSGRFCFIRQERGSHGVLPL